MNKKLILAAVLICLYVPLSAAAPFGAVMADELDHDMALKAVHDGRALPLRHILDLAQQSHGGELIEAELEDKHGKLIYEIKLMAPNGRLMKLIYDAADGTLLKSKEGGHKRGEQ